jgi:hypothetical protein
MRQESSYFEGQEPSLLYIAKKLRDAKALEELLTEAGVDYGVETDEYEGGVVFRRSRVGAFFYVLPEVREHAARILLDKGYAPSRLE